MTRRLVLSYLVITLVVLVVLEVPLGITYGRRQLDELTGKVERDAVALASFSEDVLEQGGDTAALAAAAGSYTDRTGGRVVIVDADGVGVVDTEPPEPGTRTFASRPEVARALAGEVSTGTRDSETLGEGLVYVTVPVASGGTVHGAVRVTYPTSEVTEKVQRYWLGLGSIALVSLGAVALVGVILARGIARPLTAVQDAAVRLGDGDLAIRAADDAGPPEVQSLARSFNHMATRLEALVRSQDAFVADASHQLRTPLTALRLRLENLDADADPATRRELEDALAEVTRLSRLVDGLLALARADRSAGTQEDARREPVDLTEVVRERVSVWGALAEERSVRLLADAPTVGGPWALAAPDRVAQVLDNLLANALDVAPAWSSVVVAARWTSAGPELRVTDEGPGLPPDARARAFDRFWRADPGRRSDLGGTGLGLAIVARLVAADGGTVALEEADTGGISAVVRLRAAPRGARHAHAGQAPPVRG